MARRGRDEQKGKEECVGRRRSVKGRAGEGRPAWGEGRYGTVRVSVRLPKRKGIVGNKVVRGGGGAGRG